MSDKVWMEHPDLGPDRRQQVTKKQFENAWANSGWVLVDTPYDPSAFTVDEVLEYLEENPDQRDDVIAAEKKGKKRATLLEELEE